MVKIKKANFDKKIKIVYRTEPNQFWCNKCNKASNTMYFDKLNRYCPNCFQGNESEYEVIEEFNKGGWREIKESVQNEN